MSRLTWDKTGKRFYETGLDRVVLYLQSDEANANYIQGIPWNGVTSIEENITGTDHTPVYADNMKYLDLSSLGDFGFTISAFSCPDEFTECDGSRYAANGVKVTCQSRKSFGLCYRTFVGNDTMFSRFGYKLHFVFGAKATTAEKSHNTTNDTPETESFSWECSTTPVKVSNYEPTAHVEIDCTKFKGKNLSLLEDIIYGTSETNARLPSIEELIGIVSGNDIMLDNNLHSIFDNNGKVIFGSL